MGALANLWQRQAQERKSGTYVPRTPQPTQWKIKSSNSHISYLVRKEVDGLSCTCKGFTYRSTCRHVTEKAAELEAAGQTTRLSLHEREQDAPAKEWYQARRANPTRKDDDFLGSKVEDKPVVMSEAAVAEAIRLYMRAPQGREIVLSTWGTIVVQRHNVPELMPDEVACVLVPVTDQQWAHDLADEIEHQGQSEDEVLQAWAADLIRDASEWVLGA